METQQTFKITEKSLGFPSMSVAGSLQTELGTEDAYTSDQQRRWSWTTVAQRQQEAEWRLRNKPEEQRGETTNWFK